MATIPIPRGPTAPLTPAESKYPLPSQAQILGVTPEMASDWLSYRGGHPKLRPLSRNVAAGYQRQMENGSWREATPEGYIFDTEGYIISAQHRLKAQANANITLDMWIFPNQSRDIAPFLDQGFRRTAAHIIRQPYGKDMGSGARHLAALADGDRWTMPRYNRVPVPEIVETFEAWPELSWYPSEVWAVWRAAGIPSGPHLAVLAQAGRTSHREMIPDWLDGLRTGFDLHEGDPRILLRNRFRGGLHSLGQVNRRDLAYALITKAWNAYARGEALTGQGFRMRVNEVLPTVEGFTFTTKGAAA